MAEERVRAAVLAEPNVRAVMEAFPDAELESFSHERRLTCPKARLRKDHGDGAKRPGRAAEGAGRARPDRGRGRGRRRLVKIRATAKGRILGVDIDESLLNRPKSRCWKI